MQKKTVKEIEWIMEYELPKLEIRRKASISSNKRGEVTKGIFISN